VSGRITAGVVARVVVRTMGELSITLGVVTLLFVVWQLWWTDIEANREQEQLAQGLEEQWASGTGPAPVDAAAAPSAPASGAAAPGAVPVSDDGLLAAAGEAFAILRLPTLGADYQEPVLAGTATSTLQRGIGHYEGTTGPGQIGNFSIAGHRTTYGAPFSRIAELRERDPVIVQTAAGYFVYRVSAIEIVSPQEVAVIAPVPNQPGVAPTTAMMTMTTCHPRYSARQRYIVHSTFVSQVATADEVPTVLAQG